MNDLSTDDADLLRHALGVSKRCPRGYRNFFVAGGADVAAFERLREAGLAIKNRRYNLSADPCYHVTLAGAQAVGLKELPR